MTQNPWDREAALLFLFPFQGLFIFPLLKTHFWQSFRDYNVVFGMELEFATSKASACMYYLFAPPYSPFPPMKHFKLPFQRTMVESFYVQEPRL